LILAAGKGTRMKSRRCKVLHPVAGRPMISYVTDAAFSAGFSEVCLVVGHQADEVRRGLPGEGIRFVVQEPQLGTGHAVSAAQGMLEGFSGHVLILCGDIPLIRPETIKDFIGFHESARSRLTVMTTHPDDPSGYGRIIRKDGGTIARIVEQRDADEEEKAVREINTGIYLVECRLLYQLLAKVTPDNSQREYYLTDIVKEADRESVPVHGYVLQNPEEAAGINTRVELAQASARIWDQIRKRLMMGGVTLIDPASVYVDSQVSIGEDTILYPGVMIEGQTTIGSDCVIEPGVIIRDSILGDRVAVLQGSRLDRAVVQDGAMIGPMANLRPETKIGKSARIGNFVEVKKSTVGDGTKAAHLTYLGDSSIGSEVNIGCGTITCNYDGRKKHPTIIRDRCFVGSDVQFIAPVEIGEGSVIGAGSTITRDVPPDSLAVSRAKQKNYPLRSSQRPKKSDETRKH